MSEIITRRHSAKPGVVVSRLAPDTGTRPATYDSKRHTVEAVLATRYAVERSFYIEILRFTPEAVDLRRVHEGAVRLLNSHRWDDVADILGVVEDAWVAGDELHGRIRFGDNDVGRAAERDVASGLLSSLSVGYRIRKFRLLPGSKDDEFDTREVTDWELLEVSAVSTPADPHSAFRSVSAPTPRAPVRRIPTVEEAERSIASLRLELLEAEERWGALHDSWYDNRGHPDAQPSSGEIDAAEERVGQVKRAIASAETRAHAIRGISAPARR